MMEISGEAGKYTATIKLGAEERSTTFSILSHPGIQNTTVDYQQQHEIMTAIESGINEIHGAVNQAVEARKQLNALMEVLGDKPENKELKDVSKALVKKMTDWDDKLVQRKAESNDDIINFVNKLSADYIFLKGELDTNTPNVTQGAKDQLAALNATWQTLKAEYNNFLQKDIPAFNSLCKTKNIDKVTLPDEKVKVSDF